VPAAKAHPALRVDIAQLDVLARRLAAAGARVEWDQELLSVRRFFTFDPWGNRLELLAAEPRADGSRRKDAAGWHGQGGNDYAGLSSGASRSPLPR
jgi:hypothetical protein